jgi:dCTP deaminase
MAIETPGILPDSEIEGLVAAGAISPPPATPDQVQPASLDLTLGPVAYRLRASFLPGPGRDVVGCLEEMAIQEIDLSKGGVLEAGGIFLVRLRERLRLPDGVRGRANPKSSTGRLDVFARVITDGCAVFDEIVPGYAGDVWVELSPRTFPVRVRVGSRLVQLRFARGRCILTGEEHAALHRDEGPLASGLGATDAAGGVTLSIDLGWGRGFAGWKARRHAGVVDVDVVGGLDPLDFWEPVRPTPAGIVLDPGEFYILASRETVRIPVGYAAEMTAFDAGVGEFRAHYAGLFDPGFGCGERPSRAVLEVRTRDVPFLLRQGQAICRLVFERMASVPLRPYGAGSNYQGQGLRLGKAFRPLEAAASLAA